MQKFAPQLPNDGSDTKSSNQNLESSSFIPRQRFTLLSLKDKEVCIFLYACMERAGVNCFTIVCNRLDFQTPNFPVNSLTIEVTRLIFCMKVHLINTHPRSRSNIKVTHVKKTAISGALLFHKNSFFIAFPNVKSLDLTKLEAFAEEKLLVAQVTKNQFRQGRH